MIIDSDREYECAWSARLRPVGVETLEKETFDSWWKRASRLIGHLSPLIAEQWIYKHWTRSPYCYLPIEHLKWRQEAWNTEDIFRSIFVRPSFGPNNPDCDVTFFRDKNLEGVEPYKSLRSLGTWNYPIVIFDTPDGIRCDGEVRPVRYCLIEGHQRQRFLEAWYRRGWGHTADQHSVFVLSAE
jgi:hypothetical protein